MKYINKILLLTLILICISFSFSIKVDLKSEPLSQRKNKIMDLKTNTRFFSNSKFTLKINDMIIKSIKESPANSGFITEYEIQN